MKIVELQIENVKRIAAVNIKPDGSLLDDGNLAMIADMAEEHDAQVWVERVGDGPEVSILIEEGEITRAPKPKSKPETKQDDSLY